MEAPLIEYVITASAGANGLVLPAGASSVQEGTSVTYTITPDQGYVVENVLVNGSSVGAVSTYTFSNISADNTISVSFALESGTGSLCAGVEQWDPNQNWTSYTLGVHRTNIGSLWECINVSYSYYEPSGVSGYLGWKYVGECE